MSKIVKINWTDIKSALVSLSLITAIAIGGYIITVGSIFKIDVKAMADIGVMAGVVFLVSLLKSWLTTDKGDFAGAVKIK